MDARRSGGTGRRAGLKIRFPSGSVGSIPTFGIECTELLSPTPAGVPRVSPVDARRELEDDKLWRTAVWSLRVGYVGLVVAGAGLIAVAFGATPWILAGGMIVWLATVPLTLTGFLSARHALADPRPKLWSMRLRLIHDSVHAR